MPVLLVATQIVFQLTRPVARGATTFLGTNSAFRIALTANRHASPAVRILRRANHCSTAFAGFRRRGFHGPVGCIWPPPALTAELTCRNVRAGLFDARSAADLNVMA